jgi:hypothetical protein
MYNSKKAMRNMEYCKGNTENKIGDAQYELQDKERVPTR